MSQNDRQNMRRTSDLLRDFDDLDGLLLYKNSLYMEQNPIANVWKRIPFI